MQSQRHVGSVDDDDAAKDIEENAVKANPGASSSSAPLLPAITREDLEEYFQRRRIDFIIPVLQKLSTQRAYIQAIYERQDQFAANLFTMATDLHPLLLDDDDGDDSDDGDFPPDSSTA
ncbi:hypothetical protein F0562_003740 [Nyssa sinensis]|uniref:Uncharacterized protein n=1 Tax=Nyssa sinensis TaxID=561372 RepID=A0A5J5BXN4_9ASTE|nr:hypothetical protein F0562_003740 [Nyssa sinensis]